LGPP